MIPSYDRLAPCFHLLADSGRARPGAIELAHAAGLTPAALDRLLQDWGGLDTDGLLARLEPAALRARQSPPLYRNAPAPHVVWRPASTHRRRGAGLTLAYGWTETPFGPALLGADADGLCDLRFTNPGRREAALAALRAAWPQARLLADPGLGTSLRSNGLEMPSMPPLVLYGSPFQLDVWRALLQVPEGTLVAYEAIAAAAGHAQAVRAVASALGANPIAWLVPCHRVIRKSGAPGQYAAGAARKLAMIVREGARLTPARAARIAEET